MQIIVPERFETFQHYYLIFVYAPLDLTVTSMACLSMHYELAVDYVTIIWDISVGIFLEVS